MSEVDIKGLPKHLVFKALYDNAKTQGMGVLHYVPGPISEEDAKDAIEEYKEYNLRFDYYKGRVMKVVLKGDAFDPWSYDRDNGQGAAQRAIDNLILNI